MSSPVMRDRVWRTSGPASPIPQRGPFATPACAEQPPGKLGDTRQDHACLFPARRHVVVVPLR
jgi:hypothetical protein